MKTALIALCLVFPYFWDGTLSITGESHLYMPANLDLTAEGHVLERRLRAVDNATFQYQWVSQCGYGPIQIHDGPSIEISATLAVSRHILEKTARLVHLLTRFMQRELFYTISKNFSVGVFVQRQDLPSVFPEYTDRKNTPQCNAWCLDVCMPTCLENEAKFDQVFSYSGPRVLVIQQNMDCDRNLFGDPQFGLLNLLITEMSKAVAKSLPNNIKDKLTLAYENANANGLWTSSFALDNVENYFVQASLSWFTATKLTDFTTGGMNYCDNRLCASEHSARTNIRQIDIGLYNVLNEVYNNGRGYIHSGVTACYW